MRRVSLGLSTSLVLFGLMWAPAYSTAGVEPHPLTRCAVNGASSTASADFRRRRRRRPRHPGNEALCGMPGMTIAARRGAFTSSRMVSPN